MEDGIGGRGRGDMFESRRRLLSRTGLSQGTRGRKGRERGAPLTRAGRDNMTGGTKLAPRRLGLGTWMVGVGVDVLAGRKAGLAHLLSRAPGCCWAAPEPPEWPFRPPPPCGLRGRGSEASRGTLGFAVKHAGLKVPLQPRSSTSNSRLRLAQAAGS